MELIVTSNIDALASRLRKALPNSDDFIISFENRMPYAVAVDQGYTRVMEGLTNPPEKREAATDARHAKHGEPKWMGEGLEVTRTEDTTEITVPPAGILAKSVRPTKILVHGVLSKMPYGQQAAESIARGLESILVDNTPVDQGLLVGGWKGGVR